MFTGVIQRNPVNLWDDQGREICGHKKR
jgi:hypothetical protein